jgi:hypothetical protein
MVGMDQCGFSAVGRFWSSMMDVDVCFLSFYKHHDYWFRTRTPLQYSKITLRI